MRLCHRCRKDIPWRQAQFDSRIQGGYCRKCLPKAIKKNTVACERCNKDFILYWSTPIPRTRIICYQCSTDDIEREMHIVLINCKRATKIGLPATLTADDWIKTLKYFSGMCAYCLIRPYQVLEHFLPIAIAGTTKNNCVPACNTCNARKRSHLPHEVRCIAQEDLERVKLYLETQ